MKCMYFRKLSYAFENMLSQKYFGFASLGKYDFTGFPKLSRKFTSVVSQCFTRICKLLRLIASFSKVLQGFAAFASAKIMVFRKDLQ